MKNLILSILLNIIIVILPLLVQPSLIYNSKILIIIIGSISIWLTQPVFSVKETKKNKSMDKFSVVIILIMSYVSLLSPIILWIFFNQDKGFFNAISIIGIFTLVSGILLRAWSVRELGSYFTPTVQIWQEHQLIKNGPYRIVRHPSYTGAFLAIVSFALILNNLLGFAISVAAMLTAYNIRIKIEEQELVAYFKNKYIEYSLNTKKMFPFIW